MPRLLDLFTLRSRSWLLVFYIYFHLYLNLFAEILRFGDRVFYRDWWNSSNVSSYWRLWNMPGEEQFVPEMKYSCSWSFCSIEFIPVSVLQLFNAFCPCFSISTYILHFLHLFRIPQYTIGLLGISISLAIDLVCQRTLQHLWSSCYPRCCTKSSYRYHFTWLGLGVFWECWGSYRWLQLQNTLTRYGQAVRLAM